MVGEALNFAKAPNNNLFGIKDSEDWNGEIVTVPTQEYVNGDYITVNAAFRKYTSWNDSVVDHAKIFHEYRVAKKQLPKSCE